MAGFLKYFYGTYVLAQSTVDKVAQANGMDEVGRNRLAAIVSTIDAIGMKANAAAGSAIGGPLGATAASFIPLGSTAYLAYSTAKNPMLVYESARAAVREFFAKKKHLKRKTKGGKR